jgi:hypothetical protein
MAKAGFRRTRNVNEDTPSLMAEKSSLHQASVFGGMTEPEKSDVKTKRLNRLDPLTDRIGADGYFHKMRWSWFTFEFGGVHHPLDVTRFYKDQKIAVDIGHIEPGMAKYKQQALSTHGIKYYVLESAGDFSRVLKGLS